MQCSTPSLSEAHTQVKRCCDEFSDNLCGEGLAGEQTVTLQRRPRLLTALCPCCTAKNVILAGVKGVTVHDTHDTQLRDLAAQFYLSKADIGRNRAEACRDRLQELNTAVNVTASSAALTQDFLNQFQVRIRMQEARMLLIPRTRCCCRPGLCTVSFHL